jgi:hypothetical protein
MSYVNVLMYLMSIPKPEKKDQKEKVDLRGNTEATFQMFENLKRKQ